MKMNKIKPVCMSIVGIVVISLFVVAGNNKRADQEAEMKDKLDFKNAPRPVVTEKVQLQAAQSSRSYPGVVQPSRRADLSFRVGGPLIEADIQLGQAVKKGAVLMQIDPRDYEDRIMALEAQLAGATAMSRNADEDYKRNSELFTEKVIPQASYDQSKSIKESADAGVQGLEAQLRMARHALQDTSLKAPYEGIVTEQLAENYEMIKPGKTVLKFLDVQTLEVTINVPENEMAKSKLIAGQAIVLTFPAFPGKTCEATLKEWASSAHAMTRTYGVTFSFKAPNGFTVLPGMSAEVTWVAEATEEITVPVSSLFRSSFGETMVWVMDPVGNAEQRIVETGALINSSRTVIKSGLSADEYIVVKGSRLIHSGLALQTAE